MPDGNLVIRDDRKLHWFQADGSFVNRIRENDNDLGGGRLATSQSGEIITFISRLHTSGSHEYDVFILDTHGTVLSRLTSSRSSNYESSWRYCFTPDGDIVVSTGSKIRVYKRAFRTKGMPVPNIIPQPAIRSISQRSGTNILDLDFEIIDSDDTNATVGILAYAEGTRILPQAWTDGTASKIGVPIATNQVHRVSWDVKQDWADNTGTIKFEILCQDGSRNKPVDLHFLTMPLPDGNLTISRSPLKDSDFINYFNFLLATGASTVALNNNAILLANNQSSYGSDQYEFNNCGASGRNGPNWSEVNASYQGTNLEGNVSISTQGIQEWIVPSTGTYTIEAIGARGGISKGTQDSLRGRGAMIRADFNLVAGQVLKIVIGQEGIENTNGSGSDGGGAGGGGTFAWIDGQSEPLIVAGGGGGGSITNSGSSKFHAGKDASVVENGTASWQEIINFGVSGGDSSASGGAKGWLTMFSSNDFTGQSRSQYADASFGGGGVGLGQHAGGGGGGYSGGGSGHYSHNTGFGNGGRDGGGGGGSISNGLNTFRQKAYGNGHGRLSIANGSQFNFVPPSNILISEDGRLTGLGIMKFMEVLGYRFATSEEVTKAREAATPGSVNNWNATRPIQPRNLPGAVNEYGFDTSTTSGTWVVKE